MYPLLMQMREWLVEPAANRFFEVEEKHFVTSAGVTP